MIKNMVLDPNHQHEYLRVSEIGITNNNTWVSPTIVTVAEGLTVVGNKKDIKMIGLRLSREQT